MSVDITAPLYWWKEFDTYNGYGCQLHQHHAQAAFARILLSDFSTDKMTPECLEVFSDYVAYIEGVRQEYIATRDKAKWYDLIQLLPSSYNQLRTVTLNYENLINIYRARKNHKLDEWHVFCGWIRTLPSADDLIVFEY